MNALFILYSIANHEYYVIYANSNREIIHNNYIFKNKYKNLR